MYMTIRKIAETCLPNDIDGMVKMLESLPVGALDAFMSAIQNGHGWDYAAQRAVVSGPEGTLAIGPFCSYRHGARGRIRASGVHGTHTNFDLSIACRRLRDARRRELKFARAMAIGIGEYDISRIRLHYRTFPELSPSERKRYGIKSVR